MFFVRSFFRLLFRFCSFSCYVSFVRFLILSLPFKFPFSTTGIMCPRNFLNTTSIPIVNVYSTGYYPNGISLHMVGLRNIKILLSRLQLMITPADLGS